MKQSKSGEGVQDPKYLCPHCNELHASKNKARHMRTKHPELRPRGMKCSFCSAELADPHQLQLHTRVCSGLAASEPHTSSVPRSSSPPALPVPSSSPSSSTSLPSPSTLIPSLPTSTPPLPSSLPARNPTPAVFEKHELIDACRPFLDWLGESPVYEFERSLKNTLLLSDAQQRQPRNDLCFMMRWAGDVNLPTLLQPDRVQSFLQSVDESMKGPDRLYALVLLLRKVLGFLFSQQSKAANAVISPANHPSWRVLDQYSHKLGKKRKLQQRDRAVFGRNDQEPLTLDELTTLQKGCEEEMDRIERMYDGRFLVGDGERWQKYLVTMLFVALVGQRSQTIAAMSTQTVLCPGSPGNKDEKKYLVRISASQNKAGQPVLLHIPERLTPRINVLFTRVLYDGHEGPLFLKRARKGRGPEAEGRDEFGHITSTVTRQLLGRAINLHSFRHAVATVMNERADMDDALMRGLAQVMTHSSDVQQGFYVHQKRLKLGAMFQKVLMEGLDGSASSTDAAVEGDVPAASAEIDNV